MDLPINNEELKDLYLREILDQNKAYE